MVDNDYRSIVSSKKNIRELADHKDVSFMWNDVNELNFEDAKLDWVIMNPPFHQFKDTNPVVGTSFISSSEKLLKKGGFLWMVSNAHLAYEDHIFSLFSSADKVIEKNGFKVYCARK